MKQTTFASTAWERKGKVTRRERFLAGMDRVIRWASILSLIEPHYPKAGNGTQLMPMDRMLRIYFMQQWFNLSDPAMEDALYDLESMRRFPGIEVIEDAVPDESTTLALPAPARAASAHAEALRARSRVAEQKRLLLKSGAIVDATIIDAPPSTKNEVKERDPEMKQGKKNGREWHFGMKVHVGTDRRGIVHTLTTTAANASDIGQMANLLHGAEREVYGDQAYWCEAHRQAAFSRGIHYRVNRHGNHGHKLTRYEPPINRIRSATRARAEHVFHVVKNL